MLKWLETIKSKLSPQLSSSPGDDEIYAALERIPANDAEQMSRSCLESDHWESFVPRNGISLDRVDSSFRETFTRLGPIRTKGEEASIGNDAIVDQGGAIEPLQCIGHHWGGEILLMNGPSSPSIVAIYQPGDSVPFAPTLAHLILRIDWELRGELNSRVRDLTD